MEKQKLFSGVTIQLLHSEAMRTVLNQQEPLKMGKWYWKE